MSSDKFLRFKHLLVRGLSGHSDEALAWHPFAVGQRVLDIATFQGARFVSTPDAPDFGVVQVGSTKTISFQVENIGTRTADFECFLEAAFSGDCNEPIGPGETLDCSLTFSPVGEGARQTYCPFPAWTNYCGIGNIGISATAVP